MKTAESAWRTPLTILMAGCVILTLSMGVRHTAGRFLQPMTAAHDWSRGAAVLYVLGLVLMAQAASPLAFNLSAGLLIGLGLSGTTFAVIMGVIGRHTTPERRSLALGIASAGGSFGQFAVLPVGQMLIPPMTGKARWSCSRPASG